MNHSLRPKTGIKEVNRVNFDITLNLKIEKRCSYFWWFLIIHN